MRIFTTTAFAVLISATAAVADEGATAYAGLRGSLAFDGTMSGTAATTPPVNLQINTNTGGGGSVYWGWHLPYGLRTELELLYRYQSLSDGSILGVSAKAGGYTESFAPMANLYWDIPVRGIGVQPFIGGGLGYGWNEIGLNNIAGTSFPALHNDSWQLAYNFMAGLSVPISDTARLTGMYRWLHQDIGANCGAAGFSCSAGFEVSSVDIGLEFDL